MNTTTTTAVITVDLMRPTINTIHVKQFDALSRFADIKIVSGGQPWGAGTSITYVVQYSKPDGTKGMYDKLPDGSTAVTSETDDTGSTVLHVRFAPQMFTVHGNVRCSVAMIKTDGLKLQTFSFCICVEESDVNGDTSKDYYKMTTIDILMESIGDLSNLGTAAKENIVAAINEVLGGIPKDYVKSVNNVRPQANGDLLLYASDIDTQLPSISYQGSVEGALKAILSMPALPIARGISSDGIAFTATGDDLPTVQTGSHDTQTDPVGKGRQIVFVPMLTNNTIAPTLQLNGGEIIPIRLRAPTNRGSSDQSPDATLPVPPGALMRGVPYTLTFCGKYWLVDSAIGGGNAEQVELTQSITISDTECNNVQEALEEAADALVGKIDKLDVEEVPFVTASNALQQVANDTAPITPAGVKRIVDEYGSDAQNIIERLFPEPIQLTMLPNKPGYYNRIIREFSSQKQYAKFDYCYRMPDNDTYTHFYYCKVNSGHLGDWSDADFTDLGRVIDPTLDPALAAVNWTEYIPAAERGTLKLYANAIIYNQALKYDANGREFIFNCPDQNANSWLNIKFDVDGALSGCSYESYALVSTD